MPIFEYKCRDCDHVTEVLESAGSRKRHTCEACGSRRMEKLISAFAVNRSDASSGGSSASGSCPTGTCPLS